MCIAASNVMVTRGANANLTLKFQWNDLGKSITGRLSKFEDTTTKSSQKRTCEARGSRELVFKC